MGRNSTFIYEVLPAVITGILVTGAIVFAWQEAPCDPPGCNVSTPVNVSGTGQTKAYVDATHKGWLGVATDNYDSLYGLTVGYGGNKIGIKVRGNSYLQGATSDSSGAALRVVNDSNVDILYVRNDGNVGIGITNPSIRLAIGDSDTGLGWGGDGQLNIYSNNENAISVRNRNVGIGITPAQKLEVANNTAIKLGNMYLSSGGNYAHLATNEWYNGSAWQQSAVGALIQINGQITDFFTHDVAGGHTRTLRLGSDGKITIPNLTGTGTRSVTVDSNGVLGTGVANGGNSFYASIGNVDGLICAGDNDGNNNCASRDDDRDSLHVWRARLGINTRVGNTFRLIDGAVTCSVHRTGDDLGGNLLVKDVKIIANRIFSGGADVQIDNNLYGGVRCTHVVDPSDGHNDSSCTFNIPNSSFSMPAGIGYGVTYEAIIQWTCEYSPDRGLQTPEMSKDAFVRYIWEE